MKYSTEQIEILRQTPMRDILAAEGFDTSHTVAGLFYSPFRPKERTPSFHIDDRNHRWYDHGSSDRSGGDTVSFVQRLKGLGFGEALDYLCRYNPSVVPGVHVDVMTVPNVKDRIVGNGPSGPRSVRTVIDCVLVEFEDEVLVRYAESRGISRVILDAVCSEVHYTVHVLNDETGEVKEYRHRAIGFRNVDGGWTLRYDPVRKGDKGKRSTGGSYTVINASGANLPADSLDPSSCSVIVFEGFMDYMSWLVACRPDGAPKDADVVVLNSVANLKSALPFVLSHRNVIGMLDLDAAGNDAMNMLRSECDDTVTRTGPVRFFDMRRRFFDGYKDMNECLMDKMKR